jgi:dihydropteroate synthase
MRGGRALALDRPIVIGILNVTPDSFSDGGRFVSVPAAVAHAGRMVTEGADIIDVGGESTRPQGASSVASDEEHRRVVPVIRELRARFPDVTLSVDTTKSEVARAAVDAGADIINDVSGFRLDPRMREIASTTGAGVVLMHSRGSVEEMGTYRHARYGADIVGDVVAELAEALRRAVEGGVPHDRIVVDPGIGFAKESRHSLEILGSLGRILALGRPLMVGVSRKRFIGELSGVARATERVAGTVGANVAALMLGARLFRVHDVSANRQALDVAWGVLHPELAGSRRHNASATGLGPPFPVSRSPRP